MARDDRRAERRGEKAGGEAPPVSVAEGKGRIGILAQFLLVTLAVSVIPLLIASYKLIGINRAFLEDELLLLHSQVAKSAAEEIATIMDRFLVNMELVAKAQGASSPLTREERERVLVFYLDQYPEVARLSLVTPAGVETARAVRVGKVKAGAADEKERVRATKEASGGKAFISDPYVPAGGKAPMILIGLPVYGADGSVFSILLGEVDLSSIQETAERINIRRQGNAYVVDRRGILIAHQDRERVTQAEDMNAVEIVGKYLRPGVSAGTIPFKDKSGKDMVGSYATVRGTGWGVVVQEPRDDAYATIRQMTFQAALWAVVAILAGVVTSTLFAIRLARPIRLLADRALSLASGNFAERVSVRSRSEVGQLAGTFNYMADQLEKHDRNLRELFVSTIKALAAAIDAKDPYTRGHSQRVAQISLEVAKEMNLPPAEQQKINIAALLHDVGKIGIEDRILQKPTDLTPEEYNVIRQHPRWGGMIIGPIKQLKEALPAIVCHHERLDGTGYPEGLKGSQIPLAARIIAVADTYDAMTSERQYQKAMDPAFVVDKLVGWKGSRYDPAVVDAMNRVYTRLRKPS